jgi:non-ribosomal peptide synthetase component F
MKTSENELMSNVDFALAFQHDININQLSCTINASLDLFNTETVNKIAKRFHSMLHQLLTKAQMEKPIYELSLILPDERLLVQSVNNTEVSLPSVSCVHHEFVFQVMNHPQKLAVELDDQSLTYSELLYYVQLLSLNLLNTYGVISGEIVCQCIERSLSMVSYLRKYLFMLI